VVVQPGGNFRYSDEAKRFFLDASDKTPLSEVDFCEASELASSTLRNWRIQDSKELIEVKPRLDRMPNWPRDTNLPEIAERIINSYKNWKGITKDFLRETARTEQISIKNVLRILQISGQVKIKDPAKIRHRGTLLKIKPGAIAETDGKILTIEIKDGDTIEKEQCNWQGIVDQSTGTHLGVVITKTECKESVDMAIEAATEFLGRPPEAVIHDQKSVYGEAELREKFGKNIKMIYATLNRPQNKCMVESEFGRFEQQVGRIQIDI
jgi:hypothetical protein